MVVVGARGGNTVLPVTALCPLRLNASSAYTTTSRELPPVASLLRLRSCPPPTGRGRRARGWRWRAPPARRCCTWTKCRRAHMAACILLIRGGMQTCPPVWCTLCVCQHSCGSEPRAQCNMSPQVHPTGFVDPADPSSGTKVRPGVPRVGMYCISDGQQARPLLRSYTHTVSNLRVLFICHSICPHSSWRPRSCGAWAASC